MIFWFKAKDRILSLSLLVIWIVSATALGLFAFYEAISFAEESVSREQVPMQKIPDTLYIVGNNKISDTEINNMLPFRVDNYYTLIDNEKKELHISPRLFINKADNNKESITIRKSAYGINATTAFAKAQKLDFKYQIVGDTIYIDDYITIDPNSKWAGENIAITISLANEKVIKIDESIEMAVFARTWNGNRTHYSRKRNALHGYWIMTDNGLVPY